MSGFTQAEAEAKVGKKVRLNAHFPSMPKGTTGKVVMLDDLMAPIHGCTVAVEWNLEESTPPKAGSTHQAVFWFTKEQYEKYLEEI
jgi:hypothetical protein